jgi:glyceraldehyde 3-phosphate dehydrogenase (phosphorylating)
LTLLAPSSPRVGINGFGRIGRAIFRANTSTSTVQVVALNDSHPDRENLRYLLQYDSVHGQLGSLIDAADDGWLVDGCYVRTFSDSDVAGPDWSSEGVDVLIDSAGAEPDRAAYESVLDSGVAAVLVTSSRADADVTLLRGVNEQEYDPERQRIVSTSTCDAMALAPVLFALERHFGIASGLVTTLHPWLGYQNLVDAPLPRDGVPSAHWSEYGLGRSAPMNLIPKETSVIGAIASVLPDVAARFDSFSFRVPLPAVCVAQVTAVLETATTASEVNDLFRTLNEDGFPVALRTDACVSSDFVGERMSAVVDGRWSKVVRKRTVGLIVWYDNEFGYAANVLELVRSVQRLLVPTDAAPGSAV